MKAWVSDSEKRGDVRRFVQFVMKDVDCNWTGAVNEIADQA